MMHANHAKLVGLRLVNCCADAPMYVSLMGGGGRSCLKLWNTATLLKRNGCWWRKEST